MATQTTGGGSTVSFGNAPQANTDIFSFTEDVSNILILNVLANDLGGAAKTLFSLDDGTSTSASTKNYAPADLLVKDLAYSSDAAGMVGTGDRSALGARIWIESDGTVHYDKGDINTQLQALAAGQTLTDTFTYAIQLGNGTLSWATVTLQFNGANDSVSITSSPQSGSVVEDANTTPDPSDSQSAAGTISFNDADLSDTHSATFAAVASNTTALGTFSLDPVSEAPNAANGSVQWHYALNNSAAQYLAAGQSVTESFVVTVNDGHGSTATQTVTVTITGTNDNAVITVGAGNSASGAVTEDAHPTSETASGMLSFSDVDLSDTHSVTSVTPSAGALGMLTASVTTDDSHTTGTGGVITWNYSVADSAIQYLAQGQTKTETFTVHLFDGTSTVDKIVTVTITGTNDNAVITVGASGAVTEDAHPTSETASGMLSFSDVDLSDTHSVTSVTPSAGALGMLTASVTTDDSHTTGTGGVITWNYSVADSAIQYLAQGQTKTETFTVHLFDGTSTVDKIVTVTITGTNDAPVITAQDLTGAVTEQVTPAGNLSDSGTISFSDVDLTDVHLVSATGTPIGSVLGSLTAVKDSDTTGTGTGGQLTWTYTVADSAVEYLAKDQTKVESFTITLDDGNGGLITKQIDVTITGTNDAPVITAQDLTGAVTEQVTPAGNLSDSGTISFSDVDLTDVHLVSATGTPIGSVLGSLTAVKDSDTTGTGTGGQLTWTYTVADSAVEYLAKDQTKVESFTITLDDGNGGLITKQIDVTITGTNDAPTVTAALTSTAAEGAPSYALDLLSG
ncbi:VCBS repeat-containing protein, partial [Bradyrhizobium sp. JR1.5]